MKRSRVGLGLILGASLAACAPRLIPGTKVPDTDVNRVLMAQMETYRQAVERRDSEAIMAMVSPNYFDVRGHPDDPTYHWNYERAKTDLPEKFAHVKDIRLEISVRKIEVKGTLAKVSYLFTENFVAQLPSGLSPHHDSDVSQMEFVLVGKRWLISRGL
jgi:hypothetical protein